MAATGLESGDPQQIGGYWLAGRLGSGGQGVVYEAYDGDGRRVAVKVLHGMADRVDKEVAAARRVASFCTARILAADLTAERPYIVSEYVEGPSLRRAVRQAGPLEEDALHRLATAVATALTAVHAAGVVHRDLKPDNVLLGPDGPRVIDFGIARTEEMSLTSTGSLVGTPTYMAPEVLRGERAGQAADVFAWGAVVLFAATGRDPFHADNVAAVMLLVLSAHPDLSCLPESLRPLVVASLSKTAADRPSARELLLGLVGGLDGGVKELLAAGSRAAAEAPGPSGEPDPSLGERAERVHGELDQADQAVVPAVFLRLVSVDDDSEVAPRRAGLAELLEVADGREEALSAFVAAGLLVRDGDTVALARPALLTAWPRLREWVEVERAGLPAYRRLAAAVRQWEAGGRRSGDLAQGSALQASLRWAATGRNHLTLIAAERAFLDAGTDLVRRAARRRRAVTGALAVLLVFSAGISVFADQQRRTAEQQRTQVAAQRDRAAARSLAATADGLRRDDPRRAMLLNVAAWRIAPQPETEAGLHSALTQPALDVSREPTASDNYRSVLSADGRWAAALLRTTRLNEGWMEARVRDLGTGGPGATIRHTSETDDGAVYLSLSAGGRFLVGDGRLYDLGTGASSALPYSGLTSRAAVNAAGDVLAGQVDRPPMARRAGTSRWVPISRPDVTDFVLSDSAPVAALHHGDRLELWDLTAPRLLSTVRTRLADPAQDDPNDRYLNSPQNAPAPGSRMALAADGKLVVGLDGRKIRIWNTADGRQASKPLTFKAIGVTVSPGGDVLAAWNVRQLRFWRMSDLAQLATWTTGQTGSPSFAEARFWADGRRLSVSDGHTVRVLDVSLLKAEARSGTATLSATFASDGRSLAIRQASRRDDHEVVSSTFTLLDTSAAPKVARGLDTESGGHRYTQLPPALSPDGSAMAVAWPEKGTDRLRVDVWNTATGERTATLPPGELNTGVYSQITYDASGKLLLATDGMEVDVWDVAAGRHLRHLDIGKLVGQNDGISWIVPLDAGTVLLAGHLGGGILLDPRTGRTGMVSLGTTLTPLAVAPGGRYVVFGDDPRVAPDHQDAPGSAVIWDGGTGATLTPVLRAGSESTSAAYSRDGRLLAIGARDGTIRLWDADGRRPLGPAFEAHAGPVLAVSFGPDRRTLVSAGADGTVRSFPVDPGLVAEDVCRKAGRSLTIAEWGQLVPDVPYRDVCPDTR